MDKVDWSKLDNSNSKYWKPEPDTQYIVEFTNPRVEDRAFGQSDTPKTVIVLDVLNIQKDGGTPGETIYFHPPKEFSSRSSTFINAVRPIIDKAILEGSSSILVMLRKTGQGKEVSYNINDVSIIKKYRTGA